MKGRHLLAVAAGLLIAALPLPVMAAEPAPGPEPTRIVIQCEDMQGVAQDEFGPGPGWRVGRLGYDLYQNLATGAPTASGLRTAMTDAEDNPAEISAELDVPVSGTYKVWVKYECPPMYNVAFALRIEPVGSMGQPVFKKTYGLLEAAKQYPFTDKLVEGNHFTNEGVDHDAAEGYETTLSKGRYVLTISKVKSPEPAAARSLDAILITSDLSELSAPHDPNFPMLDELRRANHVYFRFRNPADGQPFLISWNHWNHRRNDYFKTAYRELVKFYDENGNLLAGGVNGDWPTPIAPGAASPWYDLGPTMATENTSPFFIYAYPKDAKLTSSSFVGDPHWENDRTLPFAVDIALRPNEKAIVKSFEAKPGDPALTFLVQPDLNHPEGVAWTKTTSEIYADLINELNKEPRLGPIPKKLRLFGGAGSPLDDWENVKGRPEDFETAMRLRDAYGLNTIPSECNPKVIPAIIEWSKAHGGIIERSLNSRTYFYPEYVQKDVPKYLAGLAEWFKEPGIADWLHYCSFGDESYFPVEVVKDPKVIEAFRDYLRKKGETPESLGLANWDAVRPLSKLSVDEAVQLGILPETRKSDPSALASLKKLLWYSLDFHYSAGVASWLDQTHEIGKIMSPDVLTTSNLGTEYPFYWLDQPLWIETFKHRAMTLAWGEDYTFSMAEGSRLTADMLVAYLRKGASYHDTPMQFFCMAHWPGNNPEQFLQNAVLEWGQNVKDLDFFDISPDVWVTENYIACRGGLPMCKAIRTVCGMAGLIEDDLLPARTAPARVAMLLSQTSDVWEVGGQGPDEGQYTIAPGTVASNVSQEERKAIWYALRYAGHRVDVVTEDDCADGLLKDYAVLYVCGENLRRDAAKAVREWVLGGGTLFATAGAAHKDEFDAPLTTLDDLLGRGTQEPYERYRGPLRARIELPFVPKLDDLRLPDGRAMPVYCTREEIQAAPGVEVLGSFKNGAPGWVENNFGKGRAYFIGALPGQTWLKAALPVHPQGSGGPHTMPWMTEYINYDPVAEGVILRPVRDAGILPDVTVNHRAVITNRLESERSTVITVVNLALEADGELKDVELRVSEVRPVKRAWSCFYSKDNLLGESANGAVVIKLPTLGPADVIILEH